MRCFFRVSACFKHNLRDVARWRTSLYDVVRLVPIARMNCWRYERPASVQLKLTILVHHDLLHNFVIFLFDPESSLIKCNSTYRQKNRKFILSCSHLYISITILSNYQELIIHLNNLTLRYLQLFDNRDVLKAMYGQESCTGLWIFILEWVRNQLKGEPPAQKKQDFEI